MSYEDFDVEELARYLHFTPQQIEKLANRGKIPGRRVSGEWKFSPAEVHEWMEERIGLFDEEELIDVEGKLRQSAGGGTEHPEIQIADLVRVDVIAKPLLGRTRNSVISAMADLGVQVGLLWDGAKMADAIRAREAMQSTALEAGVALLHPRRPMPGILAEGFVALGITPNGIPFGGGRQLTDVFFLLCSVDDRSHLRTLARISRLVGEDAFLDEIRAASGPTEVFDLIKERESILD